MVNCHQKLHSPLATVLFGAASVCNFRRLLLLPVLAHLQFPSAVFGLLRAFVLLALACTMCCVITQSISLRWFLMISISTVHTDYLGVRGEQMYPSFERSCVIVCESERTAVQDLPFRARFLALQGPPVPCH